MAYDPTKPITPTNFPSPPGGTSMATIAPNTCNITTDIPATLDLSANPGASPLAPGYFPRLPTNPAPSNTPSIFDAAKTQAENILTTVTPPPTEDQLIAQRRQ